MISQHGSTVLSALGAVLSSILTTLMEVCFLVRILSSVLLLPNLEGSFEAVKRSWKVTGTQEMLIN
jgi:hypothetical protein